ncbi:e3 ubiquitin- ligase synoviolin [Trichoderma cornu-damae]|uniref:RING-type E3 ubiquitin transferase n=1 Tax=Trichoderma cornu-damae TaxID=654480 RepID=A0A9P8QIP8_9HYPO|nr:e3 ubiquitin- ligase synoviolin [Trichoderma cornu-damae]
MLKLRLGWYAGVSTALAGAVVLSAFHQRANFYSAMVYLAQSNFCLLVLVNFTLLLYSSFIYALTQICFGTLRAIEVEQLTERAWFAITETCLAMTIFREEIGAWFLVMFTALVTGKVWGWIGDGRVEFLEQQPPPNPRLFHLRLSVSLAASFIYDIWILRYAVYTVIQKARPNMMVMFLFEFAVLATCSWRTGVRYLLSLAEQRIVHMQTKTRLMERRLEVGRQRDAIIRQREAAAAAGEPAPENQAPLPDPDDIDEMDIEVPGWAVKGELVLWLDLITDMVKLGIYISFFMMLLMFYGLPIHIMRDLFITTRDFLKRLNALLRYRRAIQEMNRYPDATERDLAQENTCIICREEMHHWDPENDVGAIDRVRPKKLPCGHILHLGCLKSWLERQQVCPTCRRPVTGEQPRSPNGRRVAGLRIQFGQAQQRGQDQRANNDDDFNGNGNGNGHGNGNNNNNGNNGARRDGRNDAAPPRQPGGDAGQPRVFTFGPIRLGFGANDQQVRELAHQFGMPQIAGGQGQPPPTTASQNQPRPPPPGDSFQQIGSLLQQAEQMLQRELQNLQTTQQELQIANLLNNEIQRLRQRRQQQPQDVAQNGQGQLPTSFNQPAGLPPVGLPPLPMAAPPLGGMPTFPSSFAGIPPRMNSPLMTRHGAGPFSTAIPAGSPELPEGVVLPPGWSLTPLQRLDGAHTAPHFSPQTAGAPHPGDATHGAQPGPSTAVQPTPTASHNQETALEETALEETALEETASAESSSLPAPVAQPTTTREAADTLPVPGASSDPLPVVSPSPMLPNWGGSNQLFGGGSRLEQGDTASQASTQAAAPQAENESAPESSNAHEPLPAAADLKREPSILELEQSEVAQTEEEQEEPSDKGKGRAVTVEEAEDEED